MDEKTKQEGLEHLKSALKSLPGLFIGGFFLYILFTNQLGSIFNVELLDTMENWIANSSTFMKIIVIGGCWSLGWFYFGRSKE